jgi:chemotaxis protein MotB
MVTRMNRQLIVGSMLSSMVLAGCVSQSKYDALQAQNEQLHQQAAAQSAEIAAAKAQTAAAKAEVSRLQGAIKYTVNSDLLFPPGGWQMSAAGKQIIAKMAKKLAPTQQNKLLVNGYTDNAPIGPALKRAGISSNQQLSQNRAEDVMQFLISQGVKPDLVSAHGFGDANPVAPNDTAKGRAQNRRVELTLGGPAS